MADATVVKYKATITYVAYVNGLTKEAARENARRDAEKALQAIEHPDSHVDVVFAGDPAWQ